MKIFYTQNFIHDIGDSAESLTLNCYGFLNNNESTQAKITTELVNNLVPTSPTKGYYSFNSIRLEDGLQISFTVPDNDQSFHTIDPDNPNQCYYQLIIFYYTSLSNPNVYRKAFIIFGDRTSDGSLYKFSSLKLPTNKNIISITDFPEINCNLNLSESKLSGFLENPYGQEPLAKTSPRPNTGEFVSREHFLEVIHEELGEDTSGAEYLETQYINKYGIKIY